MGDTTARGRICLSSSSLIYVCLPLVEATGSQRAREPGKASLLCRAEWATSANPARVASKSWGGGRMTGVA